MYQSLALRLRVARRKSGLTQVDCAHMLDVHKSKISLLEQGKVLPNTSEICTLAFIHGLSLNSLFDNIMEDARETIKNRLATLPAISNKWLGRFNRQHTLNRIAARLDESDPQGYGQA